MQFRLAVVVTLGACGTRAPSLAGDGGTDAVPDATQLASNGGSITVYTEIEGNGFFAELYGSTTPDTLTIPAIGDGHCDVIPTNVLPQATDRSVGPTMSVSGGIYGATAVPNSDVTFGLAKMLLPQVVNVGSIVFYGASIGTTGDSGPPPFSTSFTVAIAGQMLATIAVPAEVDQDETHLYVGQDHTLHFSGGDDAQFIEIDLYGQAADANCYPVHGGTSFALPDDIFAAIIGTDSSVGANVFAKNRTFVVLDGRTVVVTGQSQTLD